MVNQTTESNNLQSKIELRFDHNFIVNTIREFEYNFQRDELAMLLFRKKNELLFRDKLSYLMHQDIQNNQYIVTPEWKAKKWGECDGNPAFDVAILKEKSVEKGYHNHHYIPHTLIEIKNAYSPFILGYGASDSIWEYKNGGGIASDIKKMLDVRKGHEGIIDFHVILAVNCPRNHRSEKYRFIASDLPNFESLNKLMIDYNNDYSKIKVDVIDKLRTKAETFNPTDISFVTLNGGQAYENEIDVLFMILSF